VEQRLALKLAPRALVEERVKELNLVRRRAHHLKQALQSLHIVDDVLTAVEQRQFGELRIELDTALEDRFGARLAVDYIRRSRQRFVERVEQRADGYRAQTRQRPGKEYWAGRRRGRGGRPEDARSQSGEDAINDWSRREESADTRGA